VQHALHSSIGVDDHERPLEELRRIFELHEELFGKTPEDEWVEVDEELAAKLRELLAGLGATAGVSGTGLPATGLTRSALNTAWLAGRDVAQPEEIWFTGKGNHDLQGWILTPRRLNRARKGPAVLYIHGGPATQYGHAFFHEFQVLAARGYTVF
jgi:acetyl esterase/lipase